MMHLLKCGLYFLIGFIFAAAQKLAAQGLRTTHINGATNKINISYTLQYFLNEVNIDQDGLSPEVLSTKNTGGYILALEYQRTTRYHLIYGGGFQFGKQTHDVTSVYTTLDFFTPPGQPKLADFYYRKHYKGVSTYTGVRLFAGYRWENPFKGSSGWDIEARIGMMLRLHLKGYEDHDVTNLSYYVNDPPTIYQRLFSVQSVQFGHDIGKDWSWDECLELYIGFSKNVKWAFVQDINIGIMATRGLANDGNGAMHVHTYQQEAPRLRSADEYNSRDLSVGIRLGVGLWP